MVERYERLKKYSIKLRENDTDAEKILWYLLRNRNLCGYKFKRQHSVPPYIVDFVCERKKLIVELDGGQHFFSKYADNKRTLFLNKQGYKVLRFWNNQVFNEKLSVLSVILEALEA